METIVNFLHEWAIPGLLLCILILVIIGIRQHRVNNSANEEDNESSGEGELPLAEESPADEETGNAEAEQVAAAAERLQALTCKLSECLLPPRRFGRYTAVLPTDVVLTAFPDLLPGDADGVEKLRKEFKTLGGKSAEKMTSSERTRYAALAHVLTLYRY